VLCWAEFKTCGFTPGVVTISTVIRQYCRGAMSESRGSLCRFILDLMRCRDWYGSDDEHISDKGEICEIVKFVAAG